MAEPLITILTAPKPFTNPHIRIIQRNALRSWQALGDQVDVIVLGDDAGIRENTRELGLRHFPNVACNEKGTPLISSMLEIGRQNSSSHFLAIVNTDVILFEDFLEAVKAVSAKSEKFLLVGQRWDMRITEEIHAFDDFPKLEKRVKMEAQLHPPAGSDYFVFSRAQYESIPDFAIGRAGWDNWFIYKSRLERWKVVDGTRDVIIVHQDHDYGHLPGGQPHYRLPETRRNVALGGGEYTIFTLFDAQQDLVMGKLIRKRPSIKKIIRELEILPLSLLHADVLGKWFFYLFHPRKAYAAFRTWLLGVARK